MSVQPPTLRITLIGLVSLALAMGVGRFAYTPLLPMMRADGLIGVDAGGWLASVHFLGYWLGALVAVRVPLEPRTMLRLSLVTVGAVTLAMGLTDGLASWLAWRFLAGIASAWVLVLVGNHVVKALDGHGRGDRQGWVFAGVGAGIAAVGLACLAFMVVGVASPPGWKLLGAVTLAAAVAVSLALGPEFAESGHQKSAPASGRTPVDKRAVIAYGIAGLGYVIPATYLPLMAQDIVATPLVFGWGWPVFGAAAFLSTLVSAKLHARASDRDIWAAAQGVMAVGLMLPALHQHMATIIGAGLAVGGTFMIITMAGFKDAHRIAPPADVKRHIAVLTWAFATGQMIGPVFASTLYDLTGGFDAALIVTAVAVAASAAFLGSGPARLRAARP